MKFRTSLIKMPGDGATHYSVWSHETRCGISLKDKQIIITYPESLDKGKICPRCKAKNTPSFRPSFGNHKQTEDPKTSIMQLKLFHNMMDEDEQNLLGLLEFIEFDECDLTLFLDCKNGKVTKSNDDQVRITYDLNGSHKSANITIKKINFFKSTILKELLNDWSYRSN